MSIHFPFVESAFPLLCFLTSLSINVVDHPSVTALLRRNLLCSDFIYMILSQICSGCIVKSNRVFPSRMKIMHLCAVVNTVSKSRLNCFNIFVW
ncbi:hypothetical protein CW304_14430 [Bacillus sp. UFRGS-B20]|nr:hypothetical protein CW304_14430 [Bacillus sp. UFRGS-B20]